VTRNPALAPGRPPGPGNPLPGPHPGLRGLVLQPLALTLSVFGASLFGFGRVEAQTPAPVAAAAAIGLPGLPLQMNARARAEVEAALRDMDSPTLVLTYARIHATFRAFLGHDDLSVARALIDYAALAQAELARRGLSHPSGTDSAGDMALAYELVL